MSHDTKSKLKAKGYLDIINYIDNNVILMKANQ
jgi:hypothetical protein